MRRGQRLTCYNVSFSNRQVQPEPDHATNVTESCIRPCENADIGLYSTNAGTVRIGNANNHIEMQSCADGTGVSMAGRNKAGSKVGLVVDAVASLKGMHDNAIHVHSALRCGIHAVSASDFVLTGSGKTMSEELAACNAKLCSSLAESHSINSALESQLSLNTAKLQALSDQLQALSEQVQGALPTMQVFVDSMNNLIRVSTIDDADEDA